MFDLAKETPRSVTSMITALFEKTEKLLSESSVKRLLKNAGLKWKIIRKSTHKQPNPDEFETARQEIEELKKQHNNSDIELWFFDETGFDLEPSVPYAWQPIETIEVPSSPSQRLNILGFLTPDNQFESFSFECSIDTDIVIATFDKFAQTETSKKRVIILDNASIHTSHKFRDKIDEWGKKGIFIKYLPPYSPKLNIIEILWRFIKYVWLPFSAYSSFKQLVIEVENILSQIGEQFQVQFAT